MSGKNLSRRDFLRLSALSASAAILVGCAPAAVSPAAATAPVNPAAATAVSTGSLVATVPAQAPVEVILWSNWAGLEVETLNKVGKLDEFKTAFPNLTLSVVPGKTMEPLLTAIASGSGPDGACNIPYAELIARGACRPIDDYLAASDILKSGEIGEAYWKGGKYKGKTIGLPSIEGFTRGGLCYNKEMFTEAGLDPEKPPVTWDELYAANKILTKFDAAGNLKQVGFDPFDAEGGTLGGSDPWIIPCSWGFTYFDSDNQKFNIDTPEMIEGWKTYNSFYDFIGAQKMSSFRQTYGTWADPTGSFVVGTQAIQINGYWSPGELTRVAPTKKYGFTWIPMPEKRRGHRITIAGCSMTLILNIAKHPDEMFKVGAFFNTPPATALIFKELGWFSFTKSFVKSVDANTYPGLDFFVKAFTDNDEFRDIELNPVESFTVDAWIRIREQTYFNKLSVEDGVKQLQSECEKALSDLLKG